MMNSQEKAQFNTLDSEIIAIYTKARNLEATLAKAQAEADDIIATIHERIWEAAQLDDPLAAYREVAKLKARADMMMQYVEDVRPMAQRIYDTAKPLQSKQAQIDRAACERQREINRLKEAREAYGLKAECESELDRLLAIQAI